jgi:hypothetical protein
LHYSIPDLRQVISFLFIFFWHVKSVYVLHWICVNTNHGYQEYFLYLIVYFLQDSNLFWNLFWLRSLQSIVFFEDSNNFMADEDILILCFVTEGYMNQIQIIRLDKSEPGFPQYLSGCYIKVLKQK